MFIMHASALKHMRISVFSSSIATLGEYHTVSSSVRTPPVQRIPLVGHSVQTVLVDLYVPLGHGAQADCAASGMEPSTHAEQTSDPTVALMPGIQELHSDALADAFLKVPSWQNTHDVLSGFGT